MSDIDETCLARVEKQKDLYKIVEVFRTTENNVGEFKSSRSSLHSSLTPYKLVKYILISGLKCRGPFRIAKYIFPDGYKIKVATLAP